MPFVEETPPAGAFSEVTEPTTTRETWTEFQTRTGKNHLISHLYQTTISSMDGSGIDRYIGQLDYTSGWSEAI